MAGSDFSFHASQDYNNNICNSNGDFWLGMLTAISNQNDAPFNSELQDKQKKTWLSIGGVFEQQQSPKKKRTNNNNKKEERKVNVDMSSCDHSRFFRENQIADTPGTHSSLVERNGNHMLPSDSNINEIQIESTLDTGEGLRKVNFPVPEVGMEFCSEEDAYNFYVSYAKQIGFRVRKGKVQRSSNGDIRKRYFFCSREGFRLKKQSNKKTKYNRKETRTGCNAKMECTVKSGKWVVSRFFEKHNHDLEDHMNVESQTRRSETRLVINPNNEAAMEPVAEATNFVKSYGIDCIAHVRDKKATGLKPENAQNLIYYLRRLQAEDPSFFHTVQLDADCRFTNIFWRDGRSKGDYNYFGDVIILDTTFKLDKYGMICAPFMGINHHRQFILFGCAFLFDESTDSLIWLLETFMEAMGRRQPKTIITDERQAMVDAVKLMMPEAQHQIGLWYIHRNASMHLSSCFEQPCFKRLFGECISDCETGEEFESRWTSLLEKFHLWGSKWLVNLHTLRDRWCHIFSRKTFSAGVQCSDRIESAFQNLMVLNERKIYEIPPQYILKRWTKSAKDVAGAVYHGKALNSTQNPTL